MKTILGIIPFQDPTGEPLPTTEAEMAKGEILILGTEDPEGPVCFIRNKGGILYVNFLSDAHDHMALMETSVEVIRPGKLNVATGVPRFDSEKGACYAHEGGSLKVTFSEEYPEL